MLSGSVGYISYNNSRPTQYIDEPADGQHAAVVNIISNTEVEVIPNITFVPDGATYLGCIADADSHEAIWVNDTEPLP